MVKIAILEITTEPSFVEEVKLIHLAKLVHKRR